MSNFEYNRRRLTSITEIQGAALVLNTPAHQALSVDDMRRMFPEASISEAPRNGTLIHIEDYNDPDAPYVCYAAVYHKTKLMFYPYTQYIMSGLDAFNLQVKFNHLATEYPQIEMRLEKNGDVYAIHLSAKIVNLHEDVYAIHLSAKIVNLHEDDWADIAKVNARSILKLMLMSEGIYAHNSNYTELHAYANIGLNGDIPTAFTIQVLEGFPRWVGICPSINVANIGAFHLNSEQFAIVQQIVEAYTLEIENEQ